MNIILYGLQMSGKTTVGIELARRLNRNCIDTDELLEKSYFIKTGKACSCREICLKEGEVFFRDLEWQHIQSLVGVEKSVISVGGGSLQNSESRKILKSLGTLIYLQTDSKVLWNRICLRGIPAYLDLSNPEASFYGRAEALRPIYEEMADIAIETTQLSIQDIAETIHEHIKRGSKT